MAISLSLAAVKTNALEVTTLWPYGTVENWNFVMMLIEGLREITEHLDIFCRVTGFTNDFLSFVVVELIQFFRGAIQLLLLLFFLLWHSDSSLSRLCWKLAVKKWFVVVVIWRYLRCCMLFRLPDSSFSVTDIEHCLGKLLTIPCSYVLLKHFPLRFVSDYTFLFLIMYYHHFFTFFALPL